MATIAITISGPTLGEMAVPLQVADADAQRIIAARCAMYAMADPEQAITELAHRMLQQVLTETVQYERQAAIAAIEVDIPDIAIGG